MAINDFGEKIGGAKKDLWKSRGLLLEDLATMNKLERDKYIIKNNIWKKPDYAELIAGGVPKRIAYFIKMVRDSLPPKPILDTLQIINGMSEEELSIEQENYISFVTNIKNDILSINSEEEVLAYKDIFFAKYCEKKDGSRYWSVKKENSSGCTNKVAKAVQVNSFFRYDRLIKDKQFGYTEEEKKLSQYKIYQCLKENFEFSEVRGRKCIIRKGISEKNFFYSRDEKIFDEQSWEDETYFIVDKYRDIYARNFISHEDAENFILKTSKVKQTKKTIDRKKGFVPPQLNDLKREGLDYRKGKQIKGEDMLNTFSFFGGEFGNYMSESDRLHSLNYSYEAFKDLARALEIEESNISLSGTLSIAYGSRGSGNAMAHYEPMRRVINLTKMKGAGSLAHEWGHALDNYLGNSISGGGFLTQKRDSNKFPTMEVLLSKMLYDDAGNKTNFYKNSIKFDSQFSKSDKGYWSSKVEMFARAFSCYVSDKLNYRSDYLCGHSDCFGFEPTSDGDIERIDAIPIGQERKRLNACFDELIKEMKDKQLLVPFDYSKEHEHSFNDEKKAYEQAEEQLSFDFSEMPQDELDLEK